MGHMSTSHHEGTLLQWSMVIILRCLMVPCRRPGCHHSLTWDHSYCSPVLLSCMQYWSLFECAGDETLPGYGGYSVGELHKLPLVLGWDFSVLQWALSHTCSCVWPPIWLLLDSECIGSPVWAWMEFFFCLLVPLPRVIRHLYVQAWTATPITYVPG